MGLLRGNPVTLSALFFGSAVMLTGGIYSYAPIVAKEPNLVSVGILLALGASLVFTMVVLTRIFWVTARSATRFRASQRRQKV